MEAGTADGHVTYVGTEKDGSDYVATFADFPSPSTVTKVERQLRAIESEYNARVRVYRRNPVRNSVPRHGETILPPKTFARRIILEHLKANCEGASSDDLFILADDISLALANAGLLKAPR